MNTVPVRDGKSQGGGLFPAESPRKESENGISN